MTNHLPKLNLPVTHLELSEVSGVLKVKCLVRNKLIILTPEEYIRQQFIGFLNKELEYPLSLMRAEKQILVNGLKKRFDLVCYTNKGEMQLLVECKSMHVALSPGAFDQAARYNQTLCVPYLCITNGLEHFCASVDAENGKVSYLKNIPSYNQLKD